MIKPRSDCVIVAAEAQEEEKTASGLIVASYEIQSKYEREVFQNSGTVVEIGDEITEVKPGDKIIYLRFGATEIEADGKEYLIINERDILVKY